MEYALIITVWLIFHLRKSDGLNIDNMISKSVYDLHFRKYELILFTYPRHVRFIIALSYQAINNKN